jgi:CheY-like chemotaxis protein
MYEMYLRMQGFETIATDDPDEAFRQAAQVDLIVTDIRLRAAADGLALIERLRQDQRTRSIPIVVVSAYAFDEDRARAQAAGCNTFLAKPCPPHAVLAELTRLLVGPPATPRATDDSATGG